MKIQVTLQVMYLVAFLVPSITASIAAMQHKRTRWMEEVDRICGLIVNASEQLLKVGKLPSTASAKEYALFQAQRALPTADRTMLDWIIEGKVNQLIPSRPRDASGRYMKRPASPPAP